MRRGSQWSRRIDRYVGIPTTFLLGPKPGRNPLPSCPQRFGLYSASAIGDTLLASAITRDIRSHCPKARIVFFCGVTNQAAAKLLPEVDSVICLPIYHVAKCVRALRANPVDILLDLSSWARLPAIYSRLSGARCTVGFQTKDQHRHYGYDVVVEHSPQLHEIDNYRRLAQAAGVAAISEPAVRLSDTAGPSPVYGRPYVVFHAWATGPKSHLREWPEERWVALGRHLGRTGRSIVLTGGPADRARGEGLLARFQEAGVPTHLFASPLGGLEAVTRLIRGADLVVSVNTGIMHLAAIAGAPTVSLNGPNSDRRWGPRGANVFSLESPKCGCGYLNLGFEHDDGPADCMEATTVEHVLAAVSELLGATAFNASREPNTAV